VIYFPLEPFDFVVLAVLVVHCLIGAARKALLARQAKKGGEQP